MRTRDADPTAGSSVLELPEALLVARARSSEDRMPYRTVPHLGRNVAGCIAFCAVLAGASYTTVGLAAGTRNAGPTNAVEGAATPTASAEAPAAGAISARARLHSPVV